MVGELGGVGVAEAESAAAPSKRAFSATTEAPARVVRAWRRVMGWFIRVKELRPGCLLVQAHLREERRFIACRP